MQLPKFWIAGRTCSIHSIQATIITGVYSDTAAKHRSNKCWAQFASHDFRGPRWSAEGRRASYSLTLLINPATNQMSRTHASSHQMIRPPDRLTLQSVWSIAFSPPLFVRTRQQKSDVVRSKKNEDEKKAGLARDVRLCSVFKKTRMKIGGTPKLRSFILPYLFWFTTCLWMEMQIKADACNE